RGVRAVVRPDPAGLHRSDHGPRDGHRRQRQPDRRLGHHRELTMDSGGYELSPSARRVLEYAEFARGARLALVAAGTGTSVAAMWADDEWEPIYSRRWLRIVGIIVVAAMV